MPVDRSPEAQRAFILANTAVVAPPLLPELPLHLATQVTPLWQATQAWLDAEGLEPPFWAFAWAGGQALARHLLDEPHLVRGRRVLDFACGSGLVALAAAMAGAAEVVAIDRDALAATATALNAERLGLHVVPHCLDVLDASADRPALGPFDVVTAGDVCYDAAWSAPALAFLRAEAARGALVLLGDPGRLYAPAVDESVTRLGTYRVRAIDDVDVEPEFESVVFRLHPVRVGR